MRNGFGMTLALIALLIPFAVAQGVPECADGVDNDGDGGTDWLGTANDPNAPYEDWDQDCTWPGDPSEGGYDHYTCVHVSPHSHTYGTGGSAGARSDTVTGGDQVGVGLVTVFDTNTQDCDGDGIPGDYDGDWETGVGGGFFGYGPWANAPPCDYGLTVHTGTVVVNDVVFGSAIAFVIGADDTSGPVVSTDPVTGETTCSTSGSITPGDPATDPTADADDCLTDVYVGSGTTCGAGGDGGYWVFLGAVHVGEGISARAAPGFPGQGASLTTSCDVYSIIPPEFECYNSPTVGTLTA